MVGIESKMLCVESGRGGGVESKGKFLFNFFYFAEKDIDGGRDGTHSFFVGLSKGEFMKNWFLAVHLPQQKIGLIGLR